MRLQPGAHLGPYEILGPIGSGGMGEVYRARDTRLGREVAVKVLPAHLTGNPELMVRFEREARSASALNHRNVVTVHDFSSRDGEAWLVMELIRGEPLRQLMSRGPVPMKRLLAIATGIAEGLAAAHAAGIVHRDLKPENVMITGDGTPKILDFGLGKQTGPHDASSPTETQARVSHDGLVVGTASYMSPEQARGERVDFRTDHFSFGVMLQEMATGAHPFRRPSTVETIARILHEPPAPLEAAVPEPFAWIVERCLAKAPQERYGSTADLAHDLDRLRRRLESGAPDLRLPPARTRSRAGRAAVALAVLGALALGFSLLRRPAGAPPETSSALAIQASVSTPHLVRVDLGEVALPVTLSPDGRYMLILGAGVDGKTGLWLHELTTADTRLLVEGGSLPAWSPDSERIAYFADGKLKTIPRAGGPPRVVCDARPEGMPAWNGDDILYTQYSVQAPGLYRASSERGTTGILVEGVREPEGFALPWWPHFLPDGRRFFYTTLERRGEDIGHALFLASLDGTPPSALGDFDSNVAYADRRLLFVREGTLFAQEFDLEAGRLAGKARPVTAGLHYFKNTGAAAFTVSRTGLLAWRSAIPDRRLVWLDRSGVETASLGTAAFALEGRLSRDDTRYAVGIIDRKTGSSDLWVYDLARENTQRATFLELDEKAPVWSPDGATLYHRSDGAAGPPDIFVRGRDGRSVLLHRGPGIQEPEDVSADGKSLLFIDITATGTDIRVLPLRPPGEPRAFVATPFNEMSPRFSPDARWVSYTSDVSGRPEVYIRSFEGPGEPIRISRDGGTRGRWRADGRELYFLGRQGQVMAAPVAEGGAGAPRLLFQTTEIGDFEPVRDGSRFLVQLEDRARTADVHLLLHWRQRLGTGF